MRKRTYKELMMPKSQWNAVTEKPRLTEVATSECAKGV